jgi:hypothetical protein
VPVPPGDHWITCDQLARRTLAIVTDALCEVDKIASVHADVAPVSAKHLRAFLRVLSGDTLDWLRAWPR